MFLEHYQFKSTVYSLVVTTESLPGPLDSLAAWGLPLATIDWPPYCLPNGWGLLLCWGVLAGDPTQLAHDRIFSILFP